MAGLPGLVTDVDRLMPDYVVELPHGGVQLATPATEGHRRRLVVGLALSATDALAALAAAEGASRFTVRAVFEQTGGGMHILAIPVLACLIYGTLGLYGGYGPSPAERLRLRSWGVFILGLGCSVFLAGNGVFLPMLSGIAVMAVLLLLLGFYAEIAVRRFLIRRGVWGAPTAIIGTDAGAVALAQSLLAQPELGLNPVGFIASGAEEPSPAGPAGLPMLGTLDTAGELRTRVEVAIFSSSAAFAANDGARPGALPFSRVVVAQQAQELQSLWLQTRALGGALGLEIRRDLYRTGNLRVKRVIDGVLAWPATLLVAPLIGLLALLIKRIDPGPAFYAQTRVGRMGKPIRVLKLRSMYVDAEQRLTAHLAADPQARSEWERYFKLKHDPRILPGIGSFIRRSSLDELPQLWNVVRGDMSLVGPRPFPAYHTDGFNRDFQALRSSVPPGLTGLWQVSSRSDGDLETQKNQDSFYIRNWSIWLDLYILLATVPAVISGSGAR